MPKKSKVEELTGFLEDLEATTPDSEGVLYRLLWQKKMLSWLVFPGLDPISRIWNRAYVS